MWDIIFTTFKVWLVWFACTMLFTTLVTLILAIQSRTELLQAWRDSKRLPKARVHRE